MGLDVEAQARYAFLVGLLEQRLDPPARLVELGAAPGDQIAALADRGYDTTAVDIGIASDEWADGTEGRMRRLFADHGVRYVEWDLEQVPYPLDEGAYDGVIFTEVFEHLRDYPVRSLEEVARVLRPGGFLFFSTPNAAYLRNRVDLLRGRSVYTPMPDWIGGVIHARHAREYLFSEVDEAMRIAGLDVVVRTSRHFHLDGGGAPKRFAKQGLNEVAKRVPTLGPQIVMVARKPG
ncbi:MAG TPA: class I SAM-dependent methyltransferase [Lapillicoccus sp.]|nr:class I SAM-dependent methyltransferase [Lapillicoccus sp.]